MVSSATHLDVVVEATKKGLTIDQFINQLMKLYYEKNNS